jgi:hypothetical protein
VELDQLTAVAAAREALDARELRLIDQARRDGATWAEIAAALGLTSRQAAEQRRGRLAAAVARAESAPRQELDVRYGDDIAAVRAATSALHRTLIDDRHWDHRFVRAALVRDTLHAAAEAAPGPLFALAAQAVTDIAESGVLLFPPPIAKALTALRRALQTAAPARSSASG